MKLILQILFLCYINIFIKTTADTTCTIPINKPYKETSFPCFTKSFTLTFKPIAAKAIISSLLLISLHNTDTSFGIMFIEKSAQVTKNPITYHGIVTFSF